MFLDIPHDTLRFDWVDSELTEARMNDGCNGDETSCFLNAWKKVQKEMQ